MARQSKPFTASTISQEKPKKQVIKKKKLDPANAYTYLPSLPKRHRTSAFQNSLSYEELQQAKESSKGRHYHEDDEESMQERVRKVAMMIASEGPQEVDSEESEVDSDEAWESDGSDEERWGDVFRELENGKGKKKAKDVVRKPAKPLTVNLDESDGEAPKKTARKSSAPTPPESAEEDEDDDEEEDEDEGEEEDEDEGEEEDEDEEMSDEEDGSEDDDQDEDELLELSDEDEDPDTLADLDAFVDQLAASDKKRKATETDNDSSAEQKKRRVLPVKSRQEIKDDAALKSNEKLDISSLISSHPSLASASALMKPTKPSSIKSILKGGVLAAPLPTVQQERLDREAAYAQTKTEGQKWSTLMKRVKEAEHLSFPLQAKERGGVKSANEILAGFKPQNEMESAVQALLNKANLTEDELTKHEDLQMEAREMTEEEIKARRAELRYQRELLFRAEAKAKRVAKIKSKTFRKLARKRAAKENPEMALEDLERLDPEAAQIEREKIERERAIERATLRHGAKNRWAREVGGEADEDKRMAKEAMLDMKEKLLRKIQGKDEGSSSEEESEDEDEDEETVKAKAFDQLAQLSTDSGAASQAQGKKGLMQMKFMQKAQERRMKEVAEQEKDARMQIELFGEDGEREEESGSESDEEPAVVNVGGNEGRLKFTGPTPGTNPPEPPALPTPSGQDPIPAPKPKSIFARVPSPSTEESNPWLTSTSSSGPSRKRHAQLGSQLSNETKAVKSIKKASKRREDEEEDEKVDIDVEAPIASKPMEIPSKMEEQEEDEEITDLLPASGVKAFKQRDLVAEAFAGDNVVEDFAAEKARQIEADAPKVEDTSLPGWGSWGGKGAKKRKTNPKFLVKTAGIEPTARKDFAHSNVIITEKKDRKASQFQLKDLPYPYTSKEQYEKSFEVPVGNEWNSRSGFQRGTLPRVVKKPGTIIEPVRRLF
ncbi:uncharacterized protein IAS62_003085 [Cryptococcus decagattii]|uniref:U3 small nucleolar RNA-associated protein 14 n=1 Tax=Cryptococcus decagattii TaxID=1859122 RepID=A0ABZ2ATE1_9TREE